MLVVGSRPLLPQFHWKGEIQNYSSFPKEESFLLDGISCVAKWFSCALVCLVNLLKINYSSFLFLFFQISCLLPWMIIYIFFPLDFVGFILNFLVGDSWFMIFRSYGVWMLVLLSILPEDTCFLGFCRYGLDLPCSCFFFFLSEM